MDNPTQQMNAPDELLSIGEFAAASGLSVSAVRFYTNRGVLRAAEIDARSGYRRFAAHQVADGQLISVLRRMEMPLASIADALAMSADQRQQLVQEHVERLNANVDRVLSIAQSLGDVNNDPKEQQTMTTNSSPTTHTNGSATLPARAFGAALAQVLPATSTDPEVPHLMTVLLEAKDSSLRVVGTDRHRLAVRDIVPTSVDAEFAVVIAAATAVSWALDLDGGLTLTVTDTGISLSGALEATASAVPTAYPDYQPVLDAPAGATTVSVHAADFGAVLAEQSEPVVLSASSAGLSVDGNEPIPSLHVGPPHQVLVNPSFLSDALAATVGADVVIDITTSLDPLVIRSADDGTLTTLVMPIAPE